MDKLNLMASFIAVADAGSYTAAAHRLGKTKALVSTHVSRLEADLGVRLITRSTRSLQLTTTGQSYYEQARKVLDDIATLEAQLRQDHHGLVGELRLSVPTTYGELVMMPFIAELTGHNPQLRVDMMLNDRYVDLVAEGFDLAVRIGQLEDSSLIARPVGSTRRILCAAPSLLARYGTPDTPEALQTLPCVFDSNSRQSTRWRFDDGDASLDIAPYCVARVNSALAAAKLASTGAVFTYSPEFAIRELLDNGTLVPVLEDYCRQQIPIHLIYPHRKHLSGKVTAFVEQFTAYCEAANRGT